MVWPMGDPPWKRASADVVSDDGDGRRSRSSCIGEEAAVVDGDVADIGHGGGHADDAGAFVESGSRP